MYENNLPAGAANDDFAPYNQVENPERVVEFEGSITITGVFKLKVSDYKETVEMNEDGEMETNIEYDDCDIEQALRDSGLVPTDCEVDWDFTEYY